MKQTTLLNQGSSQSRHFVNIEALRGKTSDTTTQLLGVGESLQLSTDSRRVLFVASGSVEVRIRTPLSGTPICCERLHPGEYLVPATERFFDNVENFEIIGLNDAIIYLVLESRWNRIRASNSGCNMALEDALFDRAAALRREVARIDMEAEERFLHYLFTEQNIDPDGKVFLDSTYQKVAYRLHLAHPTLSRMLKLLEEKGILFKRNRFIHLKYSRSTCGRSTRNVRPHASPTSVATHSFYN